MTTPKRYKTWRYTDRHVMYNYLELRDLRWCSLRYWRYGFLPRFRPFKWRR